MGERGSQRGLLGLDRLELLSVLLTLFTQGLPVHPNVFSQPLEFSFRKSRQRSQFFRFLERAVTLANADNHLGPRTADAGQLFELRHARGVDVDAAARRRRLCAAGRQSE